MSDQGTGFVITELWAWVALPKTPDGDEGILAHQVGGMMMPMIGADRTRLEQLEPYVHNVVAASGQTVVLKHFRLNEVQDVLAPWMQVAEAVPGG